MAFRRWVLSTAVSLIFVGCASPRTFVADEVNPKASHAESRLATPQSTGDSLKAEANPETPSVWSKWMGSFTKSPAVKVPSQPIQRIPLPRTDRETSPDDTGFGDAADHEADF